MWDCHEASPVEASNRHQQKKFSFSCSVKVVFVMEEELPSVSLGRCYCLAIDAETFHFLRHKVNLASHFYW